MATAVRVTPSFSIIKRELRLRQEDSRRCLSLVRFLANFHGRFFQIFIFQIFHLSSVLWKRWLSNLQHVTARSRPNSRSTIPRAQCSDASMGTFRRDELVALLSGRNCRSSSKFQAPSSKRQPSSLQPNAQGEFASGARKPARVKRARKLARAKCAGAIARAHCAAKFAAGTSGFKLTLCITSKFLAHCRQLKMARAPMVEPQTQAEQRPLELEVGRKQVHSRFISLQGAIAGPSLQASRALAFALRAHVSILKQARSSLSQAPKSQSSLPRCKQAHRAQLASCPKLPKSLVQRCGRPERRRRRRQQERLRAGRGGHFTGAFKECAAVDQPRARTCCPI